AQRHQREPVDDAVRVIRDDHNRTAGRKWIARDIRLRGDAECIEDALIERLRLIAREQRPIQATALVDGTQAPDERPRKGRQIVEGEWVDRHGRSFDAFERQAVTGAGAYSFRSIVESACRARCSLTFTAVGVRLSICATSCVDSSSMSRSIRTSR